MKVKPGDLCKLAIVDAPVPPANLVAPGAFVRASHHVAVKVGDHALVVGEEDGGEVPCLINEHTVWVPSAWLDLVKRSPRWTKAHPPDARPIISGPGVPKKPRQR